MRDRMPMPKTDALVRFERMVMPEPNTGCWLWMGSLCGQSNRFVGYGKMRDESSVYVSAHRWSYLHFKGEIPSGFEVDHKCHQPLCVNPDHLEAVTKKENCRRRRKRDPKRLKAFNLKNPPKTHCKNGHELTPDNIMDTRGYRDCKACRMKVRAAYYEKRRAGYYDREKADA